MSETTMGSCTRAGGETELCKEGEKREKKTKEDERGL